MQKEILTKREMKEVVEKQSRELMEVNAELKEMKA
jgi:hypothetical protein